MKLKPTKDGVVRKPKMFIASSAEAIPVANAVNVNMDHDIEVTTWKDGTFKLSSTTIVDILEKSSQVDFAVFIFTPDDVSKIRDNEFATVRDNVYLELGIFIGAIGKDRCFMLIPRGVELHIPSDLIGMATADYDSSRSDGDLESAVNRACTLMRNDIKRLGLIDRQSFSSKTRLSANPAKHELKYHDYKFLAVCLQSRTAITEGVSFNNIAHELKAHDEALVHLSAIKLQRMEMVEVTVEVDFNGNEFLGYSITDMGVDLLLANEDKFLTTTVTQNVPTKNKPSANDFDEDIPF